MDFLAHKCVCVNNHISTEERSRMNTGRKTSIKSIQIQFFFLHISKTTWFQVLGNPSQQAQMHTHLEYSTRSKHTNKQTPHFFFPICLRFTRPQGPQTQLSLFGGTHPSVSLLTVKATSCSLQNTVPAGRVDGNTKNKTALTPCMLHKWFFYFIYQGFLWWLYQLISKLTRSLSGVRFWPHCGNISALIAYHPCTTSCL